MKWGRCMYEIDSRDQVNNKIHRVRVRVKDVYGLLA